MISRTLQKDGLIPLAALSIIFLLSACLPVTVASRVPLCLFHYLSHFDCPGCGLTRSFISLSHGHFLQAIRFNALGPVVYLIFALSLLRSLFRFLGHGEPQALILRSKIIYILFAVLFWGQWIVKLAHQIPPSFT